MAVDYACIWRGESGMVYEYRIYPLGTEFLEIGGNYIFCCRDAVGEWVPLQIGETADLSQLLGGEMTDRVWVPMEGATHIHARINRSESARLREQADLRSRFGADSEGRVARMDSDGGCE